MTTTPDYAGLLERLEESPNHAFILAAYERRELITALRTLLESNKELERERDELKHDVSRYVEIASDEATRAEAAEAKLTSERAAHAETRRALDGVIEACNHAEAQALGLAVDLKTTEAALAEARKALEASASALDEAREDVEHWGSYAGEYFQDKHDLEGDLDRIAKQASAASRVREGDKVDGRVT